MATKTFAEALARGPDFGDNLSVDDVLGKELEVTGFERFPTRWGEACKIHALLDGEEVSILTWSGVLAKQLESVKEQLPLVGSIDKVKRYYAFV